jgi:hypothetical protein
MGLLDAFGLANMQRSGYVPPQGANLSIPQLNNPTVTQAPVASVKPSYLGSGNTNNFDTSTLANVAPQLLTPSNSPQQQALSRQAGMPGGKLNYTC